MERDEERTVKCIDDLTPEDVKDVFCGLLELAQKLPEHRELIRDGAHLVNNLAEALVRARRRQKQP